MWLKEKGRLPEPDSSLFELDDGSILTRAQISAVLKLAAVQCGVTASKVASHSLRRGGASQYATVHPDYAIARFGRWTSAAYKAYVMAHADMMNQGHTNPALTMPRFERN